MNFNLHRIPARWVVIVTGSREWDDLPAMYARLSRYPPGTLIIEGGAEGADRLARHVVVLNPGLGFRFLEEEYFRDLGSLGGPRRNQLQVDLGVVYQHHGYHVVVEAFLLAGCTGTLDCMERARVAGLEVNLK